MIWDGWIYTVLKYFGLVLYFEKHLLSFMCMDGFLACLSAQQMCTVSMEGRTEYQIPWIWSDRWPWATTWVHMNAHGKHMMELVEITVGGEVFSRGEGMCGSNQTYTR